jgi:2-polyprenyl-3-methyl-5-hydroxy-6-metoxy-1,4-benzoquinol methylase
MNCRLCNGTELRLYYTQGNKNEFRYYKCDACELVNLDISGLNTSSNQEKYAQSFPDPLPDRSNLGAVRTFQFIKKHIPRAGDFLDIGCGNGALLARAKKYGWKVHGLELSSFLAEKIKETIDIEVDVINFLEFENTHRKYDLVSLRHVLEHLPDSVLAMQRIHSLLKPSGMAILEFPNIEGFTFRLKRWMTSVGIYHKKYSPNYAPGHCNEFSKKSFEYLASHTGFDIVRWETYSSKGFMNYFYSLFNIGIKARVLIRKDT